MHIGTMKAMLSHLSCRHSGSSQATMLWLGVITVVVDFSNVGVHGSCLSVSNADFELPQISGTPVQTPTGWTTSSSSNVYMLGQGSDAWGNLHSDSHANGHVDSNRQFTALRYQGTDLSQTLSGLQTGETYTVQFTASSRPGQTGALLQVSAGGSVISGTITPSHAQLSGCHCPFPGYTYNFVASGSTATLQFSNTSPSGDLAVLIDDVSVCMVTRSPTFTPTAAPTTRSPTNHPTAVPTALPTMPPTAVPTTPPTDAPSSPAPTAQPTTEAPTASPTSYPTPACPGQPPDAQACRVFVAAATGGCDAFLNASCPAHCGSCTSAPTAAPTGYPTPQCAGYLPDDPSCRTVLQSTPCTSALVRAQCPAHCGVCTTAPTVVPTGTPTPVRSIAPTNPTTPPTRAPTTSPTLTPTAVPTATPTAYPTPSCPGQPPDADGCRSFVSGSPGGCSSALMLICPAHCNSCTTAPTTVPTAYPTPQCPGGPADDPSCRTIVQSQSAPCTSSVQIVCPAHCGTCPTGR
eukprot:m.115254 g.115254  ORF g.115254 m.115254 type:complete len:519 (-) comp21555_c1_seq3:136-1692(-)